MAFGGIAALVIGGALLFADAIPAFVPVTGMVGGVAGMALANHERLKQRVEALEKRQAQAEWRSGINRAGQPEAELRRADAHFSSQI
jgi:hypothetical protein